MGTFAKDIPEEERASARIVSCRGGRPGRLGGAAARPDTLASGDGRELHLHRVVRTRLSRECTAMMDIRENMEVVDANDQHVGIVEKVEGTMIKLSSEEILDPRKPFLDISQVSAVEGNKVKLRQKVSAVATRAFLSPEE
ncbi:DUF2171 domain-containing protein [Labrys sp. LIt4]|uniref:DUF2171 domain-containing protein n=1 Tax=Labrys TaxID=204476 RepID=UPI0015E388AA|nr:MULTISPECIES: DUF2171 domain-containing protein [Labrys]MBP0581256.1 DUF2171 domain-containing protein [Labrys sp. LIt4]